MVSIAMSLTTHVKTVRIADILPGPAGRPMIRSHIQKLTGSMQTAGFLSAVILRLGKDGKYEIIGGAHRVAAAEAAGHVDIHAVILDDPSDTQIELARIDENLLQRQLSPAQRAKDISRKKELTKEAFTNPGRGGDRRSERAKSNGQLVPLKSFIRATAETTGLSEKTISRAVGRGAKIVPDILDQVTGTELDNGAFLDHLAMVPRAEQHNIVAEARKSETAVESVEADLKRLRKSWKSSCRAAQITFFFEVRDDVQSKTSSPDQVEPTTTDPDGAPSDAASGMQDYIERADGSPPEGIEGSEE
jgi:ParB family transcriptional regulator, chromosome partitioning protein